MNIIDLKFKFTTTHDHYFGFRTVGPPGRETGSALEGKGTVSAPHGVVDAVYRLNIDRFELESGIANTTDPRGGAGNGPANINSIFNEVAS